ASLRGRFAADDPRLMLRCTLLLAATLLASYHSHAYGAVMLAYPALRLLADSATTRTSRGLLAAVFLLPTLAFILVWPAAVARASAILAALLVLLVLSLARDARAATPAPAGIAPGHPS